MSRATRLTNVPTVTTLNPGTSNPSLTLSNNDLTATGTHTGTSYQDISAALGQIGGDTNKTYFEVTFTSYNTTNTFSQANEGIALNDSSVGGGQNNAVWIDNPGSTGSSGVWTDGGQQTFSIPFPSRTTPFTIGCIVDRVNGKIAFTADGTTWSNSYSLSAGTGGVNISFLAGLVYIPNLALHPLAIAPRLISAISHSFIPELSVLTASLRGMPSSRFPVPVT